MIKVAEEISARQRLVGQIRKIILRNPDPQQEKRLAILWLDKNPDVLEGLIGEFKDAYVGELVYVIRGQMKTEAKQNHDRRSVGSLRSIVDADAMLLSMGLSFPMPSGGRLADWTGPRLSKEADDEESQAGGHMKNALLYRKLAARVGNRMVGDVLSNEDVAEIWRSVLQMNRTTVDLRVGGES